MKIDGEEGLLMFIQHFQPIKEYLRIVNRKVVKSYWNNYKNWDSLH